MTRDEIIKLVHEEVARALLYAAKAVTRMDDEPRRDKPNRLVGTDEMQSLADSIAGRLPQPDGSPGMDDSARRALERTKRMREENKELEAEMEKLTPEERKLVKKGTTVNRQRELLEQVKRSRGAVGNESREQK